MNITLISPFDSYGIRLIAGCIKSCGHHVDLFILPHSFTQQYDKASLDVLNSHLDQSSLIGISLMTNHFVNMAQVTESIRSHTDIPIIWGGIHPTIRPEECLAHADMVCIGEGEISLPLFIESFTTDSYQYATHGIWFRNNGSIVRNPLQPLTTDLNHLPFPDYDGDNQYSISNGIIKRIDLNSRIDYTTLASRGCPYGCSYCINSTYNRLFQKKQIRKRSISNIIGEIKYIMNRMPNLKRVTFDDDSFMDFTLEEIEDFSYRFKSEIGLSLIVGGISPLNISKAKMSLLVNAGMREMRMGIQSASEKTKRMYNRNYSNKKIVQACSIISSFNTSIKRVQYDIILDNPWETEQDLIETLIFLSSIPKPFVLSLFSLTFYPETALYSRALNDGIITDEIKDVYLKYYHRYNRTYLNMLFSLLSRYSKSGYGINTGLMRILTNKTLRGIKVSHLLYILLFSIYPVFKTISRIKSKLLKVL